MRPDALALALLLLLASAAAAQPAGNPAPAAPAPAAPEIPASPWAVGNHISLTVTEPGASATYTFENAANGDFRVDETSEARGVRGAGSILMIAGRGMAVRGLSLTEGAEVDAVDRPVLSLQLLKALLEKALPAGPPAVRGTVPVEVREALEPLAFETPTTQGEFRPPWRAQGTVRREAEERLAFDLTFRAPRPAGASPRRPGNPPGNPEVEYRLKGVWLLSALPPSLPDDLPLAGWALYQVGPIRHTIGNSEIFGYGAERLTADYLTVGAFRQAVAAPPS
ncbi:MAG TPA: hypothetical protein VMM92_08690 [Thermoanaerobaculia bacterium]|nr:hypothetical protein [Thermoanaerobaculia bacterium]